MVTPVTLTVSSATGPVSAVMLLSAAVRDRGLRAAVMLEVYPGWSTGWVYLVVLSPYLPGGYTGPPPLPS